MLTWKKRGGNNSWTHQACSQRNSPPPKKNTKMSKLHWNKHNFFLPILVCSGCHNKTPYTGCLQQEVFISYTSRGWKSNQGPSGFSFWWGLSAWFADGHFVLTRPLLGAHVERESMISLFFFLKDYQSYRVRAPNLRPHSTLITSWKSYLQMQSQWGLEPQHFNLGGYNSVHDTITR